MTRTKFPRRKFLHLAAGAVALPAISHIARAQDRYPSRPIKLVGPFAAGGPTDIMGRLVAQHLSTALGQQVIVDNRPGAGSTIAGKAVATAAPDGYTLMINAASTMAIGPTLYPNAGYDPRTSFAPIGYVSNTPYVMITRPQAAQKTLPELIAYAKANPGKLNFGIPNGAPPHMIAAWFRNQTGTDIAIVPYRGASTVITDLMGGQVDLGFETTSVTLGHVREGKVRALGVLTAARLPEIPDVPTMIEGGVPDFIAGAWLGLVAPARTPQPIIARLNAELVAGLNSSQMQERFKLLGAIADPGTPEDFAAFMMKEIPKWVSMVKLSGIKPE
jgi:tripartite-type tricarboxylate transporter receptor subunit TctC